MRFNRQIIYAIAGVVLYTISTSVYAIGILDAYSLALEHSPFYKAALKEREAGDEYENIARAGLLPKMALSYQNSPRNWQKQQYQQGNIFGETSEVTKRQQYRSYAASVTLSQPLFDYEAYARYKAGVAQTLMANERYRGKFLDLSVQVIGAYIDTAYAREQIALAVAQKTTYQEQLAQNERLLSAGEGTVTDVSETQARYSLAVAQEIEARDELEVAQRKLEVIIGVPLAQLDELQVLRPGKFQLAALNPASYKEWQEMALRNNPDLAATRHSVDAARFDIERNRAGFLPLVELYAAHGENDSSSDNTVNQKYRTNSVGMRVSVPLYSGGAVAASTRQAAARYGQAMYELDAQIGTTLNELRKQYNLCVSSQARLAAYELALKSANVQVEATRKSVLAGQRANVDVLNAEQQRYSAYRDLAAAKYDYLKSWITLLSYSGALNESHIKFIAQKFTPPRNRH